MAYLGDFADGGTVYGYFSTHSSTGANVAPSTAFEAADVIVYAAGSATQITAGITVTSPFDTEVGFHQYAIDLTATGYDTGSDYSVVLAPDETVDGETITAVLLDTFSIENRYMRGTDSAATAAALATVDTNVDAILVDTAEIGAAGAGLTALATQASVNTVDTNVDAILVDTGTTLPASISTIDTNVDAILVDTAEIGAAGAGLTAVPWNASWDAEVQSEVQDAIEANNLDHLLAAAVTGADVVDNSVIASIVSSAATADWDTYVNTTDAFEALRDRGDAAWTTGGGGSITDIIQWHPLVPGAIDLANTATYQLGIALTNQVDNLPTAIEITPGTISIDRKAQGGTSWSAVVTDAACSEAAGLIYYDEVFDTATTYAAGDVLRITFKNQVVTVSANDYELTGAGRIFYSAILADTPDVNIAQINGSATNVAAMNTFFSLLNGSGQIQASTVATDTLTAAKFQDGALTAAKFGSAFLTATSIGADAFTAAKFAADVTTELQSGLATSAEIAALNDVSTAQINAEVVDALATDTYAELGAVPAANAPIADKLNFLFALARNKITQTASTQALRNDADSGNIGTAGVSDSGTTFTRDEWT